MDDIEIGMLGNMPNELKSLLVGKVMGSLPPGTRALTELGFIGASLHTGDFDVLKSQTLELIEEEKAKNEPDTVRLERFQGALEIMEVIKGARSSFDKMLRGSEDQTQILDKIKEKLSNKVDKKQKQAVFAGL